MRTRSRSPRSADMARYGCRVGSAVLGWLLLLRGCAASTNQSSTCTDTLPLDTPRNPYSRQITTSSAVSLDYLNQALVLIYAFNHDEAKRSVARALAEDPNCAFAYWVLAYAYAGNINRRLTQDALQKAQQATSRAMELVASFNGTEVEAAVIKALSHRFPQERTLANGTCFDLAYAAEMGKVAAVHSLNDADVLSWYAEAAMDTMAWDYYEGTTPKPLTESVVVSLEKALSLQHDHPLALHLYIHIIESSPQPRLAEESADTLRQLTPEAIGMGHLMHMPGHIYSRVGRYHDASEVNARAISVDRQYFATCDITADPQSYNSYYRSLYFNHKHAFLVFSSAMEGRSALSLSTTDQMLTEGNLAEVATTLGGSFVGYTAWKDLQLVRFGQWQSILGSPQTFPQPFAHVMRHFARAYAYSSINKCGAALHEASAFSSMAVQKLLRSVPIFMINAGQMFDIANATLNARLAAKGCLAGGPTAVSRVRRASALVTRLEESVVVAELTRAVEMQSSLPYMEPPYWPFSLRCCLGQALLDEQRFAEAANVFQEDLKAWPENGWSLRGLQLAREGQGMHEEASDMGERFQNAWKYADVELKDSVCL